MLEFLVNAYLENKKEKARQREIKDAVLLVLKGVHFKSLSIQDIRDELNKKGISSSIDDIESALKKLKREGKRIKEYTATTYWYDDL